LTGRSSGSNAHVTISNEALALFVRILANVTASTADPRANCRPAKGRDGYEGFVEALGRRLAKGQPWPESLRM